MTNNSKSKSDVISHKSEVISQNGFTLIEVLITIAIVTVVSAVGYVAFFKFRGSQAVELTMNELVSVIRETQKRAVTQQGGKQWGIRFSNANSSYEVFSGPSYASGTVDKLYSLGRNIIFGNPATSTIDTIFSAISGKLSENRIISLVNKRKDGLVGDITMLSRGTITNRLEHGFVGYWHLDEGTSTAAYDASGMANTGTLINGPVWQASSNCKAGSCLSFDGVDDYVNLPSVNPTSAITVTAWVKSATATGYSGVWQLVSKYNAFILGTGTTGGKNINFIVFTTNWQYGTYYTVSDPQNWHFFAGVYDSVAGVKKLYVDGIQRTADTVTGAINNDTGPIHIAHREGVAVGTDHFNGFIDEVRIYNRALSATEISNLYNDLK